MPDTPAIAVEQQSDAIIVRIQVKDLDEVHIAAVKSELEPVTAKSTGLPIILDMSNVKFVPSLTLGVLVKLASEFKGRGQRLVLVSMQPMVRQVFALTRLDKIFEIAPDISAAMQNVGGSTR